MQYGPRIAATAVYLQNAHFLPEDRLAEIFRDLFGVALCAATLAGMSRKAAQIWRSWTERVRDQLVSASGVKHLDETGFRIAGQGQWLHVLSTAKLTYYRTSRQRGGVLEGLRGILVHDHWASYFKVPGVLHAMCNIHHLRELEALAKIDGEDWARRMQQLLRRAKRAVDSVRERGWRCRGRYWRGSSGVTTSWCGRRWRITRGWSRCGRPSRDGGAARSVGRDIIWRCG